MFRILCFLLCCLSAITPCIANETVVAIHGFLVSYRSMFPIRNVLRCANFDVCLWGYPSRKDCIVHHAQKLVCTLQAIACDSPGKPINFVTHSIGGLVLRNALNQPGCPQEAKIGRAVLLAPPNQGSELGRRYKNFLPIKIGAGTKSGWELINYTPCDVLMLGSFPPEMQVLVIAGCRGSNFFFNAPNDGFLLVDETRLDTPYYFYEVPVGHGKLLSDRYTLRLMRDFLLCGGANCEGECY